MKYGETLRQRSIPAWSHHNIDYDDIKRFIKEQTTPDAAKGIIIPGRTDEHLLQFENALFKILNEQHERIDLFVRSKAGEIRCRLGMSEKQLRSLQNRVVAHANLPIPVARLERFSRLEHEIIRAGEEINSLARFISAQRTAFRKLLKKYKKWTGSTHLEDRLREFIIDDPKSFAHLDLGPALDDYSSLLQRTRSLYETCLSPTSGADPTTAPAGVSPESAAITAIQAAIDSGSKVEIDSAIANVPLGEAGSIASYFVHPECVIELQMLLLQHCTYCLSRSRANSIASPVTPPSRNGYFDEPPRLADFYNLVADDPARFTQEQSALTFADREHRPGATPQRTRFWAIWNDEEEARVCFRPVNGRPKVSSLKKKHVSTLFDRNLNFKNKHEKDILDIRKAIEKDDCIRLLYKLSGSRSRFTSLKNSAKSMVVATLDTAISIEPLASSNSKSEASSFPFAVLTVRQEGRDDNELLSVLDDSHLVERIRGFSMEYQAVWQVCQQSGISQPPWSSLLSRDIRKLPPPAIRRPSSKSGSATGTRSNATPSERGGTDSATAVETGRETIMIDLEAAPLRSFRKKRHRPHAEATPTTQPQPKYWNEYDHPEDGEDGDAYVIYIDPNEKSALDRLMDKLASFFKKTCSDDLCGTSADDDESSDDEEEEHMTTETATLISQNSRSRKFRHYGSSAAAASATREMDANSFHSSAVNLPQATTLCYVASFAILIVAYFLAYTGRHKYQYAVDTGIIIAVLFSVLFAVLGYGLLWRRGEMTGRMDSGGHHQTDWLSWALATCVLTLDAIASGGLLAWVWTSGR